MEPSEFLSDGGEWGRGVSRSSPRRELQGPRPGILKVNKESYKIRKPPVPPPAHQQPPQEFPPVEERQPLIIYAVSPKVIHTTVSDFMNLVQRLTGNTSAATSSGGAGDLSPAARLASIEKTSPCSKDREISHNSGYTGDDDDLMDSILESTDVEMSRVPGILSPAPTNLQPISPGFFSPAGDSFLPGYINMFIPSPSTLFSAPMVSPSQSWCDPFDPFFDF
ncbi:protein MKS1-like [Primulina tabacum]|uniref:protein MKS1-like n=1 Tax=Primulina tabacum TaxID=48773 RepID=UPI003F5A279D